MEAEQPEKIAIRPLPAGRRPKSPPIHAPVQLDGSLTFARAEIVCERLATRWQLSATSPGSRDIVARVRELFSLPFCSAWYVGMTDEFLRSTLYLTAEYQHLVLNAVREVGRNPLVKRAGKCEPLPEETWLWRCVVGDRKLFYHIEPEARKVTLLVLARKWPP